MPDPIDRPLRERLREVVAADAVRVAPSPQRPTAQRLQLGDFDASTLEVLREIATGRAIQVGAKAAVTATPAATMNILGKTGNERLLFEIGLAQQEVQGRKLQDEIARRRQLRDSVSMLGPFLGGLQP
jgi:hypothetical protein